MATQSRIASTVSNQSTNQSTAQKATNTMLNAQLIQNTQSFASVTDYVAHVRTLKCDQIVSATEWEAITNWRDLCVTLGVDYEAEAKGKARPAIDKVAKRLHGVVAEKPAEKAEQPAPKSAEKAKAVDKPAAKTIAPPKAESVTVKEVAGTQTNVSSVTQEPMPKRMNFQSEDAFDAALDTWFAANPEKLVNTNTKTEPAPAAKVTPTKAEQLKQDIAAFEQAKKPVEKVAQAVQEAAKAVGGKSPAPITADNVDETAQALAKLLRGLKPNGNETPILELVDNRLAEFMTELSENINQQISTSADVAQAMLHKYVDEAVAAKAASITGTIEIKVNGELMGKVKGLKHKCFEQVMIGAVCRDNMMLVGPAGGGKSTICEQIAEGLSLPFYGQSVCGQTSKGELLGYMDANGKYSTTAFRQAFEQGGVFLLDEIDNGNPNVLAVLNSALANNWCSFADGMVRKHADFLLIAGANTYGTGASAQYVGRNALDAATLDRFSIIEFPYDEELEMTLSGDKSWCRVVQAIRKDMTGERVIISPRASIQGSKSLAAGKTLEMVMQERVIKGMAENLRVRAMNIAKATYKPAKPATK